MGIDDYMSEGIISNILPEEMNVYQKGTNKHRESIIHSETRSQNPTV